MANLKDVSWQMLALRKRLASLFKTDWTLDDYPVHAYYTPPSSPVAPGQLKPDCWRATIINWDGIFGAGATRAKALEALGESFDRAKNQKLPRPGSKFKTEVRFADTSNIDKNRDLVGDFVRNVLELPWAFISNDSSLWDFHGEETNQKYHARILEVYGVDVTDIESGNLADILERISSAKNGQLSR
jgi:hypothetical protein